MILRRAMILGTVSAGLLLMTYGAAITWPPGWAFMFSGGTWLAWAAVYAWLTRPPGRLL